VEDSGSGAIVTITVEDTANRDSSAFKDEIRQLQAELNRKEGQIDVYRTFMPIFQEMIVKSRQMIITNPTMIEGAMSKDTYNIHGQAGAVGPQAHVHDNTFQQIQSQSDLDLPRLAQELAQLRAVMKQETEGEAEQDEAIGAVAAAEKAAGKGDGPNVLRHLQAAGKWAFGIAEKIGMAVAADAIEKAMQ
jgi:hypothetical protein